MFFFFFSVYVYCGKSTTLQNQFLQILTFEIKKWTYSKDSLYTKWSVSRIAERGMYNLISVFIQNKDIFAII